MYIIHSGGDKLFIFGNGTIFKRDNITWLFVKKLKNSLCIYYIGTILRGIKGKKLNIWANVF